MTFLEDVKKKYPVYAPFLDTIRADYLIKDRYNTDVILRMINRNNLGIKNYKLFAMLKEINKEMCEDVLCALNTFSEALANQQDIPLNYIYDFVLGGIGIYIVDIDTAKECYNILQKEWEKSIDSLRCSNIPYPSTDILKDRIIYNSDIYPIKTYFSFSTMKSRKGNDASDTIYVPFHQIVWY